MALIDDFKARFPEFDATEVDARFPLFEDTWPCYYGGSYSNDCDKEAILFLLAHLYEMETSSSDAPFQVAGSKSVGDVSVSYNGLSDQNQRQSFFNTTKYGQRFLQLTMFNSGGYFV